MKICIDAGIGLSSTEKGGIYYLLPDFLNSLSSIDKENEYLIFGYFWHDYKRKIKNIKIPDTPNFSVKTLRIPNKIVKICDEKLKIPLIELLLKKEKISIYHSISGCYLPDFKKVKKIYTVYDLSFEINPEFYKDNWYIDVKSSIFKADFIITPSFSTKNDLIKIYKIPETKIKVIYLGVNKRIFKPIDRKVAGELTEAQKRSEERIGRLEVVVEELAEAQKRTEQRVEELTEAQKRTEQRVEELAEAQKRTEQRVEELAEAQKKSEERISRLEIAVGELAEAQKKSEERISRLEVAVGELVEAQKKSEERIGKLEIIVGELAEAQKRTEIQIEKLTRGLGELREEFGGFTRTMSYAFENEAFRYLPKILKEKYNIEIEEKFIRAEVKNKEINIFGKAKMNGKKVYIVGEAKLRIDERRLKKEENVFKELEEKTKIIKEEYGDVEVIKILVTHFAPGKFVEKAKKENVIVVQSFEWI